jgi:hypothetical protein
MACNTAHPCCVALAVVLIQTHEGLPLVDGGDPQQPTKKVHTYAQQWAFQADGYDPVYYAHSSFV